MSSDVLFSPIVAIVSLPRWNLLVPIFVSLPKFDTRE